MQKTFLKKLLSLSLLSLSSTVNADYSHLEIPYNADGTQPSIEQTALAIRQNFSVSLGEGKRSTPEGVVTIRGSDFVFEQTIPCKDLPKGGDRVIPDPSATTCVFETHNGNFVYALPSEEEKFLGELLGK